VGKRLKIKLARGHNDPYKEKTFLTLKGNAMYAHEMITRFNMSAAAGGTRLNFTGRDVVFATEKEARVSARNLAREFNIPLSEIPVYPHVETDPWN
jgi:hypothetical protein